MIRSYNSNREQTQVDLQKFASINQTGASSRVSSKYKVIPTTRPLAVLAELGWFPVQAFEARTRVEENQGFQKHAIRLSNPTFNKELVVGSTIPQIMLTNSHSGTSSFELSLALFEKVCANGLMVARNNADFIRVAHRGFKELDIEAATLQIAGQIPDTLHRVDTFKNLLLDQHERRAFAEAAIELRYDGEKYEVDPIHLLRSWRAEEKTPNLWNTYNVVQEKIIKGGVQQVRSDGSRIQSRAVKNINENIKLNRALWSLTEKMAQLKA